MSRSMWHVPTFGDFSFGEKYRNPMRGMYPNAPLPEGADMHTIFSQKKYDPYAVTILDIACYISCKNKKTGSSLYMTLGRETVM